MSFRRYMEAIEPVKFMFGLGIPLLGFYIGKLMEHGDAARMTRYRDRSALFGRPPPREGETEVPTWP